MIKSEILKDKKDAIRAKIRSAIQSFFARNLNSKY